MPMGCTTFVSFKQMGKQLFERMGHRAKEGTTSCKQTSKYGCYTSGRLFNSGVANGAGI